MNDAAVDRILRECALLRKPVDDPELSALRTAIFLEDALGVTLADEQFDLDPIADPEALRALVARSPSFADVRHLRPGQ